MPGWDFITQAARARGAPLGHATLNQAVSNQDILVRGIRQEHFAPGAKATHNALEIPRAVGRVAWSGSAYSKSNFNTTVASVAAGSAGEADFGIDEDYYPGAAADERVYALINCNSDGIITKPWVAGFEVVDSGTLRVRQQRLTSSLGSGDTWATGDADFDVAFFTTPVQRPDVVPLEYDYTAIADLAFAQGQGLRCVDDELENLRGLIKNQGLWVNHFNEGHNFLSTEHTALETAKEVGTITNTAGTYSVASDADFASVSKLATGEVEVTLSATYSASTQIHPFAHADNVGTGWRTSNVRTTANNKVRVYSYEFDGTNWSKVDTSFFLVLFAN